MKRALLATLLVLASTSASRPAHADDEAARVSYRAVIDRVDLEPSALTGYRLRVYLSALALQGHVLDLTDPKSLKLYVGTSEKKVPFALGTYDATQSETAIVVLVQASLDYSEALGMISDSIDHDLLSALSDRTQIAVLPFGENAASGRLSAIKQLRGKVTLATDNSAGDPTLLDSVDRALMLLKKAKTTPEGRPLRKMIVVIGDGRDLSGDKERVTRTGNRANKEGVRIHTMAYSPSDVRRPMLALGELSKRSLGTFRWVRKGGQDSWKAELEQLRDEINKQYVLTYFFDPTDEIAGRKIHIASVGRIEATSNEIKVGDPKCAANDCTTGYCAIDQCVQYKGGGGRGVLGWLLLIGGVGLGLILLLGVIGFFITKAQQSKIQYPPGYQPPMPGMPMQPGMQPGMPGMQPGMPGMPQQAATPGKQKKQKKQKGQPQVAPGFLPSGRPIPALLITSGPRTGERHLLRNGYLIGKQPGCDLIIEDGYTSSQHAQIGMDDNGMCKLYDRGSTNGTYVNGVRITESVLQHGITIRIGSTEIRFLAE